MLRLLVAPGILARMTQGVPDRRMRSFPAQQRDYLESSEWHDCSSWYSEEEVAEINRHYGWEKYRLVPEKSPEWLKNS